MRHRLSFILALALSGAGAIAAAAAPAPLSRMKHLVIITLENRSFDNLYGEFPGADGFAFAKRLVPQVDERGVPYDTLPVTAASRLPHGLPNRPFCIDDFVPVDQKTVDISHALDDEGRQINRGRMDRFVQINAQKALALGYYHTMNLPLAKLAAEYTLCDRFFHAAIGGSMLSHVWMIAAQTARWPDAPDTVRTRHDAHGNPTRGGYVTEDGYVIGTCQARLGPHAPHIADSLLVPPQDFETIGDRLSDKGISWGWYAGGWDAVLAGNPPATYQYHHQPFVFFRRYGPGTPGREHLRDETEFVAAAREGRLPAVSFVKPVGEMNEHPGYADVMTGEKHTVELVEAVMHGPQWDSTAIVITYDEHGGFWDHVPPPVVDRWGPGLRVPAIILSPLAKRHYVDHTTYDTTSLLALIEMRWGLAPLATRDAHAKPLLGAFEFAQRRR